MKVSDWRIPYKDGKKFRLIPFGDVHLGSSLCAKKHVRDMINTWKDDPDTFWIDMGDGCDMIVPQGAAEKKRWNAKFIEAQYAQSDRPVDLAIKNYVSLIRPIKDRLIAMVDSNHHQTILQRCGTDPTARICEALWQNERGEPLPEATLRRHSYSGYLRLHFDRHCKGGTRVRTLKIYLCHGIGGSTKTEGGALTSIGNNAKYHRASIHLYGHNHNLHVWDVVYTDTARYGPKIISDREIRVNTGTFQKQYLDGPHTSYGERAQFKPSKIGYPVLEFKPSKHGVDIIWWEKVCL